MEELKLEPLAFVGYQRQATGQPGTEASHAPGLVCFAAPNGTPLSLHPSPPLPASRGSVPTTPPPPPPQAPQLPSSLPPEKHAGSSVSDMAAADATAEDADALLRVLTTTSAPPDTFQVEFLCSSSSSSSRSASSPPSPQEEPAARLHDRSGEQDQGEAGATVDKADAIAVKERTERAVEAELESMNSSVAVLPPSFEHGIELVVREECSIQLNSALTQEALRLFGGKLPQPPQAPPSEETNSQDHDLSEPSSAQPVQQQPQQWSEAVHYHRVVLMGYHANGAAYLMAVPFAQPGPSPSSWRLCPLPLLMCPVTQLTRIFSEAATDNEGGPAQGTVFVKAEKTAGVFRCAVLPRPVGENDAVPGSRTTSSPPSAPTSPPRGGASPLSPPPPPPSSTSLKLPLSSSASLAGVYMSPPLRWEYKAIGHVPALHLAQLFHVVPHKVYQLARPREEVVFVGVACGVPWIREVVRSAGGAVNVGRGVSLHLHAAHQATAIGAAAAAAAAPAAPSGYRWKDSRGYAVPLVFCHDAQDLRGRHGLVDEEETKPDASGLATDGSGSAVSKEQVQESVAPAPAVRASSSTSTPAADASLHHARLETPPPNTLASSQPPVVPLCAHDDSELSLSPPNTQEQRQQMCAEKQAEGLQQPPQPPSSTAAAAAAPLFLKEGSMVFVPGRFGVMLECVAKPAVLKAQFGVLHGDRLVPRAAAASAAASASSSPSSSLSPVTVMGLYNRNVLVVLADGESQATQIPIRRGPEEVTELFSKVAEAPLSNNTNSNSPVLTRSEIDEPPLASSTALVDAPPDAEETVLGLPESINPMLTHPVHTTIFVERHDGSVSDEGAATHTTSKAGFSTPEAAEGDPDKASSCNMHVEEEDDGEGAEVAVMPSAPPADAQAAPMFASTHHTPSPSPSLHRVEEEAAQVGDALFVTADAVVSVDGERVWPGRETNEREAEETSDARGEKEKREAEMVPTPTALQLTHAEVEEEEGVSVAPPSETPTAAPLLEATDVSIPEVDASAPVSEGDVIVVEESDTVAEEECEEHGETTSQGVETAAIDHQETHQEEDVEYGSPSPSAIPTPQATQHTDLPPPPPQQQQQQQPHAVLPGSSLPLAQTEDTQECSSSGHVLSSDHTLSILPTPSASLARRLQSERYLDDEHTPHDPLHGADVDVATDKLTEHHSAAVAKAAAAGAPRVPHLPLPPQTQPSTTTYPVGPVPSHIHLDEETLNTAATAATPMEGSAARSSESPAAIMPESYYAELSADAAEPPHVQGGSAIHIGAARHAPHLAPASPPPVAAAAHPHALATPPSRRGEGALYQEVFTPSYSPPAGAAEVRTAPRGYGAVQDVDAASHPTEPSVNPRPFSMMATTTATNVTIAAAPSPFISFLKAFAIYSLRHAAMPHKGEASPSCSNPLLGSHRNGEASAKDDASPLPGLTPVLDFYRAEPLVRIVAATEGQRRCQAAWHGGLGNTELEKFRKTASTTVFEELCVDELVMLLTLT